ncbi:MAG TPA: hypothetical protein PKA42_03275 [Candidatus Paceibacterota bacterium]|nr:hypothetical protein [Candidatus Paceibacterota bacterium]HMO83163.1 hypothetical protein [Candidatus Paceibacterota bacterium]
MKIGIFSLGLNGLTYLKATASELPEHDYELLADTRQISMDATMIADAVEKGIKQLISRRASLIIVLDKAHEKVSEILPPKVEIIFSSTPTNLKTFLANNPELEKSLSRNQTRNITLTENTPETDLAVATILGGTLIRE